MGAVLVLFLQFLPSAQPTTPRVCTAAALQLPTTSLTQTATETLAQQLWPDNFIVRPAKRGDNFSISSTGTRTYYRVIQIGWSDPQFGFAPQPVDHIIGEDKRGSYRRAWNAAMIWRCQRGL